MTIENTKTKCHWTINFLKGCLIALKWLFLFVVSILLIAFIVLKGPYKVILLLAILLITPTLIPKRVRKYFYILYAVMILIAAVWVLLPDNNEGWSPVNCQSEIDAFSQARSISDDQNAATIYNRTYESYDGSRYIKPESYGVFEEVFVDANSVDEIVEGIFGKKVKGTFFPDFWDKDADILTHSTFWSSKEHPELAKWIESKRKTVFDQLAMASDIDKCFIPYKHDPVLAFYDYFPQAMRAWGLLAVRAGNNALADGRVDEGIEYYSQAYKMAHHLYQSSSSMQQLIGIAIEGITHARIRQSVLQSEPLLNDMQSVKTAINSIDQDWSKAWKDVLEAEVFNVKNTMLAFFEINSEGKVRAARGNSILLDNYFADFAGYSKPETYWQERWYKFQVIPFKLLSVNTPEKMSDMIDQSYEYYKHRTDQEWLVESERDIFYWRDVRLNIEYIFRMYQMTSDYSLRKVCTLNQLSQSYRNATYLCLALREYKDANGNWPKSLNDLNVAPEMLVDPFTNGSYAYKLVDDSFMFYSKGENGIDDGGIRKHYEGKDDLLFWPLELPE